MFTLGRRFFAPLGFIVREATRIMYPTIQSLGDVECGSIQGLEGVESCFQVSFEYSRCGIFLLGSRAGMFHPVSLQQI